jgi:HD-GYP domain-containing protein (c-di-GMP phosphodiesterase class II)
MRLLFGEHPWTVIVAGLRDMGLAEGAQYLIGILGALAAAQERWSVVLLLLPTTVLYFTFRYLKEMREDTRRLLESMADTVDLRDPYTGGHSRRVAEYSAQILTSLGLHGPEVDLIVTAARVHDIGKIGIPDAILNKTGPLTPEERAIMETHAERGAELLVRYTDFSRGTAIVRHHHENWDGTGYPHRLKGTTIPFGARVIAVADSFDAMTSDRPYRKGMPVEKAARILREGRGKQWDEGIVDAFVQSLSDQIAQETPLPEPTWQPVAPMSEAVSSLAPVSA